MRLIDADAAIDRYYAEWEYHCIKMGEDDRQWLRQCIDQAPTIEAKFVKRGEWGEEVYQEIGIGEWMRGFPCKVCGRLAAFKYPICPNCGADMRGET